MAAWHDRMTWRAHEQADRHFELKQVGWWPCANCGILNRPTLRCCVSCKTAPTENGRGVNVVDYKAHATREAAVVLDECGVGTSVSGVSRELLLSLMAACWLQGVNYGSHETLALAEAAFERVRAEL